MSPVFACRAKAAMWRLSELTLPMKMAGIEASLLLTFVGADLCEWAKVAREMRSRVVDLLRTSMKSQAPAADL